MHNKKIGKIISQWLSPLSVPIFHSALDVTHVISNKCISNDKLRMPMKLFYSNNLFGGNRPAIRRAVTYGHMDSPYYLKSEYSFISFDQSNVRQSSSRHIKNYLETEY